MPGMTTPKPPPPAPLDNRYSHAIDPGPTKSSYVIYYPGYREVFEHETVLSRDLVIKIREVALQTHSLCVIESISSYGMPVGQEVFDTCVYIGIFLQTWRSFNEQRAKLIYRRNVKQWLCKSPSAKDSNVRQVVINRFYNFKPGGGKTPAVGTKSNKGPLYGVVKDEWQALALAIAFAEGCASFSFC